MPDHDRLAAWIAYLASQAAPPDAMRPLELDGFLSGVIVSPELIPPSEWIEEIWGEDGPQLDDVEQARRLFDSVSGHYNDLIARMDDREAPFRPMFVGADGVATADRFKPWIKGFLKAVALYIDDWQGRGRVDPDFDRLVSPILTSGRFFLGEIQATPEIEDIKREMMALIPDLLPLLLDHVRRPPPKKPRQRAGWSRPRKGKSGAGRKSG